MWVEYVATTRPARCASLSYVPIPRVHAVHASLLMLHASYAVTLAPLLVWPGCWMTLGLFMFGVEWNSVGTHLMWTEKPTCCVFCFLFTGLSWCLVWLVCFVEDDHFLRPCFTSQFFETTQQPNYGQKILETHLNNVSCGANFGSSVWERYVLPPLYVPTPQKRFFCPVGPTHSPLWVNSFS